MCCSVASIDEPTGAAALLQRLTQSIDALYVPDIDASLDEQDAKREFWDSFRVLGEWYVAQPPW